MALLQLTFQTTQFNATLSLLSNSLDHSGRSSSACCALLEVALTSRSFTLHKVNSDRHNTIYEARMVCSAFHLKEAVVSQVSALLLPLQLVHLSVMVLYHHVEYHTKKTHIL